ncbi:MAG: hypothetical protein R3298_07720 [Gammaproteobacteria bacterium]|nr:hypothetical protein [Gammaproteobacteria bacterium]
MLLSVGVVLAALAGLFLLLLVRDLVAFDGTCNDSLLPFLADSEPRACEFTEYFERHGLFAFEVIVITAWPVAVLFVVLAVFYGVLSDRRSSRPG